MDNNKIIEDLFKSVELIAQKTISETDFPTILIGNIIERLHNSDSYKISYLNTEITASTLGGLYKQGDEVFVLMPTGLNKNKFILGKTNNRTPTISFNEAGLSEADMVVIQEIIEQIQNLSSDNIINPLEKQTLAIQWENIQKSFNEITEMRKPYEDDVIIDGLIIDFNDLKNIFEDILSDMTSETPIDGQAFREKVGQYLQKDTQARLEIQEAIRKELTYKVEIFSTNGETFKNNIIETTLRTTILQGKTNVSGTIPNSNIKWYKLDPLGEPIPGWIRQGREITIDENDVDSKQVFQVNIQVEDAIVASDIVTIVDLNDIGAIQLTVESSRNKNQIFTNNNIFVPDYSVNNQVLTANVVYNGVDVTSNTTFEWQYNQVPLTISDDRVTLENNKLTIKKNLMNPEDNPVMKITCKIIFWSEEHRLSIEDFTELEFTCVKDGDSPILPQLIPTKGTAIKNEWVDLSATAVLTRGTEFLTPSRIRWERSENTTLWQTIPLTNDLPVIAILRETIDGTLHVRAKLDFEGKTYETPVVTFIDLLDSVSTTIIGSGIFRDGKANNFTAEVYLGQQLIENPEEDYDIIWSITNETQRYSLFSTSWPKLGQRVTIEADEIPDNAGVVLTVGVFRKD